MVPVNSSQCVDWAAQENPNQMDPWSSYDHADSMGLEKAQQTAVSPNQGQVHAPSWRSYSLDAQYLWNPNIGRQVHSSIVGAGLLIWGTHVELGRLDVDKNSTVDWAWARTRHV
jgi:hypothetical protein